MAGWTPLGIQRVGVLAFRITHLPFTAPDAEACFHGNAFRCAKACILSEESNSISCVSTRSCRSVQLMCWRYAWNVYRPHFGVEILPWGGSWSRSRYSSQEEQSRRSMIDGAIDVFLVIQMHSLKWDEIVKGSASFLKILAKIHSSPTPALSKTLWRRDRAPHIEARIPYCFNRTNCVSTSSLRRVWRVSGDTPPTSRSTKPFEIDPKKHCRP